MNDIFKFWIDCFWCWQVTDGITAAIHGTIFFAPILASLWIAERTYKFLTK